MAHTRATGGGPPEGGPWVAVAGTRPNYVKLAPLVRAAESAGRRLHWIDAGQHADPALHGDMLHDLGLPAADATLVAPPAGPERVERLARMLAEPLASLDPSVVLVLGDVDASLAAALAAHRLGVPIAHVEAGLRCGDATMPEEVNRQAIDALADRFYTTEASAHGHLAHEGIDVDRHAVLVGNVMADALRLIAPRLAATPGPDRERIGPYLLVTLHRQANVDDPERLDAWVSALFETARGGGPRVLFPVHPRTARRLGDPARLRELRIVPMAPLSYLPFLAALRDAEGVVTDSGGVQVEAVLLGTPCVIARAVTEHQLSLTHGGAVLAGAEPVSFEGALRLARAAMDDLPPRPEAWDGHAAERLVADLARGFPRRHLPGA